MKERDFQTAFSKRNTVVGVFELKFCKGTSLPFKSVAEHQERALSHAACGDGLYHKITDSPFFKDPKGRMRFTKPKPFDCFFLRDINAYVVIMFWVSRKKKNVYYINIDDFIIMRDEADRKSITEKMAAEYAAVVVDYLEKREEDNAGK